LASRAFWWLDIAIVNHAAVHRYSFFARDAASPCRTCAAGPRRRLPRGRRLDPGRRGSRVGHALDSTVPVRTVTGIGTTEEGPGAQPSRE